MLRFVKILSLSCLLIWGLAGQVTGQTFTFECLCDHLTGDTCDICPGNNLLVSRSFHGLLIRRNGTPYRWIDEPYTIKRYQNESIQFLEQIPNPDQVTIALFQTPFATMEDFVDSTTCFCNLGGAMAGIAVDTPIIGDGTPGNPITIGQFGADTTSFLNWNGSYWYPSRVNFTDLLNDLPYYINDEAAIAGGLTPGKTYLLAAGNTFALPTGLYKVVVGCGYDCAITIKVYVSDAVATLNGVPSGREYVLAQGNVYGLLYGWVKSIGADLSPTDTLLCNTVLPSYNDDPAAIVGGLTEGDFYTVSVSNPYGAPAGIQRMVSTSTSTSGDPPSCCDVSTLPYYPNDAAAITGGLSSGYYYYLSTDNTLGFPYGTKKVIP
jgi:hypothetical protein